MECDLPKLRSLFYGYTERLNTRFPFGFFILLDLNVFSVSLTQQIEDPLSLSSSLISYHQDNISNILHLG